MLQADALRVGRPRDRDRCPGAFEDRQAAGDSFRLVRTKARWRPISSFLLFGEGNVPWLVRELILKGRTGPRRSSRA